MLVFDQNYSRKCTSTKKKNGLNVKIPFFILFSPRWINNFRKSEFGGFEKQEIKLFWPYNKLCTCINSYLLYNKNLSDVNRAVLIIHILLKAAKHTVINIMII